MMTRPWAACLAWVMLGFVLSSLALPQLTGQEKAKDSARVTWEYEIAKREEKDLNDKKTYNDYGNEGWELAWVGPGAVVFKRPKR